MVRTTRAEMLTKNAV